MKTLIELLSGYDREDIRSHTLYWWRFCSMKNIRMNSIRWKSSVHQNHWYQIQHVFLMYSMKAAGNWELSWDLWPDNEYLDLYPVKLSLVSKEEYENMMDVLVDLNIFPSKKEAKRNGWNKPVEAGDYFFKKKTWVVRVY